MKLDVLIIYKSCVDLFLSVLYMKDGICITVSFLVKNFNIICRIKHIN